MRGLIDRPIERAVNDTLALEGLLVVIKEIPTSWAMFIMHPSMRG